MDTCDHVKRKQISESVKECIDCGLQICSHARVDYDSTCMFCGELITEISIEQSWCDAGYSKNTACNFVKNTKDHVKYLDSLGYPMDVIEATMEKFTKVGCSLSEEPSVVAVCLWLTLWDMGCPRTMVEIANKHGLTKSKIKDGRKIVLSFDHFKPYRTKYITISSMIRKIIDDLKLDEKYYQPIYQMAKFVEEKWETLKTTKRSAPQNIASACVFVYIQNCALLSHLIDTPTKKKEICNIMGPSNITVDKLAKQIVEEIVKLP